MEPNIKNCLLCGNVFFRSKKLSQSQWDNRKFCSKKCSGTKLKINTQNLIKDYQNNLSSADLALKYNCSSTHILRLLKANNVSIRCSSEALKLSHSRESVKNKLSKSSLGRRLSEKSKNKLRLRVGSKNHNWRNGLTITKGGYLQFTDSSCNGEHRNKLLHIIICEYKYNRKLIKGEHVHHIDGNKLNNNPNNLIILSASEHAKIHTGDRQNGKRR